MELVKVTSKKNREYKGKVYDLQVKNIHSYTVDDLVVHNSAAGSLISYCLNITTIDPIKYGLYFERFLNPGRAGKIVLSLDKISFDNFEKNILPQCDTDINFYDYVIEDRKEFLQEAEKEWDNISLAQKKYVAYLCLNNICGENTSNSRIFYLLGICDNINNSLPVLRRGGSNPDVDIDLGTARRHEVFEYLQRKYGEDKVASITTFGKMWSRSIIRNVGGALGLPTGQGSDVDKIAKLFPSMERDFGECIEESEELKKYQERYPELFSRAKALAGKPKSVGVHAAGTLVTPVPIEKIFPMGRGSGNKTSVTQWDMYDVEETGFLKLDLLGLNTLDVIDRTVKLIHKRFGHEINIEEIDMEDPMTIKLFNAGKTNGLFQLERKYVQDLCRRMDIKSFEEVCVLNALIRPGTLHSGMTDEYIKRKTGENENLPLAECLKDTLKDTYNIMVYQEDLMRVVVDYAGFTMAEADNLRKGVGKKLPEKIRECKELFMKKSKEIGRDEKEAESIFNKIEKFAQYGFNKCLSLDTVVETKDGMKTIENISVGDYVLAPSDDGKENEFVEVKDVIDTGVQDVYEVTLESGKTISCTMNHEFWCSDGKKRRLKDILLFDCGVLCIDEKKNNIEKVKGEAVVHTEKIICVKKIGELKTKDITVDNKMHRFYANGIVTSNSHAVSYGKLTFQAGWLKCHYFLEFMTELLNGEANSNEPKLDSYLRECRLNGVTILPPDARVANPYFQIEGKRSIRFGLSFVKGVSVKAIEALAKIKDHCATFTDLLMHDDSGLLNKEVMYNLISVGAFDYMGRNRAALLSLYYREIKEEHKKTPTILGIKALVSKKKEIEAKKASGVKVRKEISVDEILEEERNYRHEGPEWTLEDYIMNEHELCKCYIVNNPLSPFEDMIEDEEYRDIMDIVDGHYNRDKPVKLVAVLKSFNPHTVTRGKSEGREMCFLDVFDSLMEIGCIAFCDVYDKIKDRLFPNTVYTFTGKFDGESIILTDVVPLMNWDERS